MTLGVGAIFWFISHNLPQCHALQGVGDVRIRTLTLIEREDDTRSWGNFSGLFLTLYYNVMPSKGLGIHTYRLLASQEYVRC
jgi:hypothetical protein